MSYRFSHRLYTLPKKRALGVSLGTHTLRAIECTARANHLEFSRTYEKKYDETFLGEHIFRGIGTAFRELFRGGRHKDVVVSLPESFLYTTLLRIPQAPEKDIHTLIELHLENHIPYVKSSFQTIYEVISRAEDSILARVVVYPKTLIEELRRTIANAGGRMLSTEGELSSIARATIRTEDRTLKLLVNVTATATEIGVSAFGSIVHTKTIPEGGEHILELIGEKIRTTPRELKEMLATTGFSSTDAAMYQALLAAAAPIADGIESVLLHFHAHAREIGLPPMSCGEIILCGDSSYVAGLPEYLSRAIGITTAFANPWANAHLEDGVVPALMLRDALAYADTIGAALRDLKAD